MSKCAYEVHEYADTADEVPFCQVHECYAPIDTEDSDPCPLAEAEAAIQRVRDWLDNAGFPADTESPYGQGYYHAMADARRALDGDGG